MARTKQDAIRNTDAKVIAKDGSVIHFRRKHRFRPGTRAMMDIRKAQKSTSRYIPRAAIERLLREIAQDNTNVDINRFERSAIDALWEGM